MGPPIFGLAAIEGAHRIIGGSGWGGDGYSLGLRHAWNCIEVEVTTDTRIRSDDFEETIALNHWFGSRMSAIEKVSYPLTLTVDRSFVELPVDGHPTPFTYAR